MKKKLLVLMFIVVLLFTAVFTACGGEQGESTKEPKSSESVDESQGDEGPQETVTLTIGVPLNANVTSYTDNAFTQYLEEKANVKLEFVFFPGAGEDYVRQLTLMAAANQKMPDVLWQFLALDTNTRNDFGEEGYLMDLTDLIEKYAPDYKATLEKLDDHTRSRIKSRATAPDGGIYGMPLTWSEPMWDDLQDMLFINQEWLDTLGLEVPTTVDELYTVLKAFKERDPNGNGIEDEIPLFGRTIRNNNICTWIINAFIYYNDSYELNVENGKLYAPYTTDEYRQALVFLNKLCKEGLLSDLSFSANTNEMKAMVTPGTGTAQVGIWAGHPAVNADQTSPILEQYQPYAGLKDETGKGGYIIMNPPDLYFGLLITADCEHPEAAMRLCNLFYQDETITRQRHGELGVDWVDEEGDLPVGGTGHIKVINSNAFFKGNSTWCMNGAGIFNYYNYSATTSTTKRYDEVMTNLLKTSYENVIWKATNPPEVCQDVVYTKEQYERRTQYSSLISSYVLSQRNLFILGNLDPSNDGDWNKYLNELKNLGLEDFIAVMQEVYDAQ